MHAQLTPTLPFQNKSPYEPRIQNACVCANVATATATASSTHPPCPATSSLYFAPKSHPKVIDLLSVLVISSGILDDQKWISKIAFWRFFSQYINRYNPSGMDESEALEREKKRVSTTHTGAFPCFVSFSVIYLQ